MSKPGKMASEGIKPISTAFSYFSFRHSFVTFRPAILRLPQWRRPQRCVSTIAAKRSPKRLKYSSQRLYKKGEEMIYVEMDPVVEDTWKLEPVVRLIKDGAVGVIPTDTVYAIVCDLRSYSSIERLRRIKGVGNSKPLSILCRSLRDIDTYTTGFPRGNAYGQTNIFRAVKHCLPGPGLDFLVDGGVRVADPSTVVDMTRIPPTIIRLGKGPKLDWMEVEGEDASAQEALLPIPV